MTHARLTGIWTVWAETLHAIPNSFDRTASAELRRRIDAWRVDANPKLEPVDATARDLSRLAINLMRAGLPNAAVLRRLDDV
ncbi:MAG TPA: hypothetical protein VFL55_17795, partial [Acetobacteraceae bacterium]|nr:hypothetical protein [Acetobacteraceae bacterium]